MSPKKADPQPPVPGAIWFRPRPPTRGRGGLTRETITTAAVEVLDEAGLPALTLRTLAGRLGVHATSLYWHVASRDDLLDLAVDAVFGEVEIDRPAGSDDWGDEVAGFMRGLRAVLLRHPWSSALAASRPLLGPQALQRSESVYAALGRAGFTGPALTAAAAAVGNLVIATVATETAWNGQDEAGARQAMHEHLRTNADRYPTLATLPDTGSHSRPDQFERALDALLRGLRAQTDGNR